MFKEEANKEQNVNETLKKRLGTNGKKKILNKPPNWTNNPETVMHSLAVKITKRLWKK